MNLVFHISENGSEIVPVYAVSHQFGVKISTMSRCEGHTTCKSLRVTLDSQDSQLASSE